MCGILFHSCAAGDTLRADAVRDAAELIQHRGPDGMSTQYYTIGAGGKNARKCVMSFCRLAIINLSVSGMQPFTLGPRRLICNGEIYNYKELQRELGVKNLKSDVDIILHMLVNDRHGECLADMMRSACQKLDGDFAFVTTEDVTGEVMAARDCVGVRPLFYGTVNGAIVSFASEAKALVDLCDSVAVFPPGHFWTSSTGFCRYMDVYLAPTSVAALDTGADSTDRSVIAALLTDAVRKRVEHTDRPLAFLCSGGLDSALVESIAERMYPDRDLHAFSIEYCDQSISEDALYATELLKRLPHVQHTRVQLTKADIAESLEEIVRVCETPDTTTLRAAMPMYHLARYISDNTDYKVILSGEGADELFAGYYYFSRAPHGHAVTQETRRLVKNTHMFDLLRADRCFAAHGLEIRVPFLDVHLLRHVLATPGEWRMHEHGLEKALLRDSFYDVEPLEASGVLRRGKMRMTDGVGSGMASYIVDVLNDVHLPQSDSGAAHISAEEKLRVEKEKMARWFFEFYEEGKGSRNWVISRDMPDWASEERESLHQKAPPISVGGCAALWW
ncbi:asparagine synthase-domain-containing protein [Tribonema minus]|uniref:asparagine synthase (glutamine-hydrolyzing) n=1 Tax=Tribonema minus TaxID=303371 RepID=A0A836CMZ5_9STRA|nr:asparagine synthase-domain-containing protein [Tribonema minus]